jgi:hypothetical protein
MMIWKVCGRKRPFLSLHLPGEDTKKKKKIWNPHYGYPVCGLRFESRMQIRSSKHFIGTFDVTHWVSLIYSYFTFAISESYVPLLKIAISMIKPCCLVRYEQHATWGHTILALSKYQSFKILIFIRTNFYCGKNSMVSYCDMTPESRNSGARAKIHW